MIIWVNYTLFPCNLLIPKYPSLFLSISLAHFKFGIAG